MSKTEKLIHCKECKEELTRHEFGESWVHTALNLRFQEEGFCSYSCKLKNKGIEQSGFLKEAMRMLMHTGVSHQLNKTGSMSQHKHGICLKPWFIALIELVDEHMEEGRKHEKK